MIMKNKILTVISITVLLFFSSCVDEISERASHSALKDGERVQVQMSLKIPAVTTPKDLRSRSVSDKTDFSVNFFDEDSGKKTRASDGTTELYNLWMFQFHSNGVINGLPQKLSDHVQMVNDMVILDVILRTGTNQTIYLVALGQKVTATGDLGDVRHINDLENMQLDYIENKNGLWYSRVTKDSEVPYAGFATGLTVERRGDGDIGEIVYDTPEGFSGGIDIKRLMSRVSLKYTFNVSDNVLEGLRLLKVPSKLLINPSSVSEEMINSIYMIDLDTYTDKDEDGSFTSQWYIAQNKQGTVSSILRERERYLNVNNTVNIGAAPELATNIEVWSYSKKNKNLYTIHQIYVGNNNINNFDIEANNYYNLRTDINSVDLDDGRIRSFQASQKVYLSASSVPKTPFTGTSAYPFDAHYSKRPVIIYANGQKVSVGIYSDADCTKLIDMNNKAENWLQLSVYSNYTEIVRNGRNSALTNKLETDISIPTRLVYYLHADEYLTNDDGSIHNIEYEKICDLNHNYIGSYSIGLKDRTLYVKVTTEGVDANGIVKSVSGIYTMVQHQGLYMGALGGELKDGQYTKGLIMDVVNENLGQLDDLYPIPTSGGAKIPFGYNGIYTKYGAHSDNSVEDNYRNHINGKEATLKFATNPNDYVVNNGLSSPIPLVRKINGHVDLYQYNYHSSFVARYCYDLNRDKNGNGVIDYYPDDPERNEYEWYLPAANQAGGIAVTLGFLRTYHCATITELSNTQAATWSSSSVGIYSGTSFMNKTSSNGIRCVREIPLPDKREASPKLTTYVDGGETYAMIDLTAAYGAVDRTTDTGKAEIYEELDLYSYSTTGETYDSDSPKADTSKPLGTKVLRSKKSRHNYTNSSDIPQYIPTAICSRRFIVSPTDVYNDGDTKENNASEILKNAFGEPQPNRIMMSWADAVGRLATANTQTVSVESDAVNSGCSLYRGKNGTDAPGSWRVPSDRELMSILMFAYELNNNSKFSGVNLDKFYNDNIIGSLFKNTGYWSSAISGTPNNGDNVLVLDKNYTFTHRSGPADSSGGVRRGRLRCIKDIP